LRGKAKVGHVTDAGKRGRSRDPHVAAIRRHDARGSHLHAVGQGLDDRLETDGTDLPIQGQPASQITITTWTHRVNPRIGKITQSLSQDILVNGLLALQGDLHLLSLQRLQPSAIFQFEDHHCVAVVVDGNMLTLMNLAFGAVVLVNINDNFTSNYVAVDLSQAHPISARKRLSIQVFFAHGSGFVGRILARNIPRTNATTRGARLL
jgi:hypothetical protein